MPQNTIRILKYLPVFTIKTNLDLVKVILLHTFKVQELKSLEQKNMLAMFTQLFIYTFITSILLTSILA